MKNNFNQKYAKSLILSFLFLVFLLQSNFINAQPTSQTFNSSGTYTVPTGYTATVTIQAWGAGGGGGTNSGNAKGGGGGGAYASIITTLNPGSYTVTVGTGGTAGNAGGNSSFSTLVIAAGGSSTTSSTGGAGGTTAASTGTTLFAGGNGGNGASTTGIRGGGGGGGSANTNSNGGNGGNGVAGGAGTGGSGGSGMGNGGQGGNNSGTPDAAAGINPGAGGGGRGNSGNSQAGANGEVIVTLITILPVKFGEVKAIEKQAGIQIEWNTYSEINVDHFEIQRSSDGRIFTTIGQVGAKKLNSKTNYSWFDASPLPNNNYYRIKSIGTDSKSDFTSILKISFKRTSTGMNIYPNPVLDKQISLQTSNLEEGDYLLLISNNQGQQVYRNILSLEGRASNHSIKLPASLKPGMYILQLLNKAAVLNKAFIIH